MVYRDIESILTVHDNNATHCSSFSLKSLNKQETTVEWLFRGIPKFKQFYFFEEILVKAQVKAFTLFLQNQFRFY